MSKRDRRDSDGRDRDRRDGDRRDFQPEDEHQRRFGEGDTQEGESLTALKAILSKVAAQLKPLNLSAEESIGLVEQLYGSVLDVDLALAGEADDTRKSSTLAYLQNTTIRRDGDTLVVEYPTPGDLRTAQATPAAAPPSGEKPAEGAHEAPSREAVPAQARGAGGPRPTPPRVASDPRPQEAAPAEPRPPDQATD
jgi:hypothetical protein